MTDPLAAQPHPILPDPATAPAADPATDPADLAAPARRRSREAEPSPSWFDRAGEPGAGPNGKALPLDRPDGKPGGEPDDELFDDGWTPPRRASRLTVILAAGIVAASAFAVGAFVQRNHDQGLTAASGSATGTGRGAFGAAGGFPPGGLPSGQALPNGAAVPNAGGSAGSAATGAGAQPPVVVGTVTAISGAAVTVKNFAGRAVVVQVPATATVTTVGLAGLKAGAVVAVYGVKAADGTVTATSVISRRSG